MSECNADCNCKGSLYQPVCGDDEVLYYSPCYAGCNATMVNRTTSPISKVIQMESKPKSGHKERERMAEAEALLLHSKLEVTWVLNSLLIHLCCAALVYALVTNDLMTLQVDRFEPFVIKVQLEYPLFLFSCFVSFIQYKTTQTVLALK